MCHEPGCAHGAREERGPVVARRALVAAAVTGAAAVAARRLTAAAAPLAGTRDATPRTPMDPATAVRLLEEGSRRFAAGRPEAPHRDLARLREVAPKQTPFAAVLGCADSRVPVEITFDVGFGDVFVNRVAGNIVTPELIASLEFGCQVLGCSALVVLGHSGCGAVTAAMEGRPVPGMISSLYHHIRPAVAGAKGDARAAVRANVAHQASLLLAGSTVLASLVEQERLAIVGAVFDLPTGAVEWLPPAAAT